MAIEAADRLERSGIRVDLLEVSSIKPIDSVALIESARKTGLVLTVEEHTVCGGTGSAIAEVLSRQCPVKIDMLGIEDRLD